MRQATLVASSFILIVTAASTQIVSAQGTKQDYQRADGLQKLTRGTVFRSHVDPHWFNGSEGFWYRVDLPGPATQFLVVDAAKGVRRPAFDHAKLAEALSKAVGKPQNADHLPIDRIQPRTDGSVVIELGGKAWRFIEKTGLLEPAERLAISPASAREALSRVLPRRRGGPRRDQSPDGKWLAFVKDHNIHLREKSTGKEFPLGEGGSAESGDEAGVFWSPDSTHLVAFRTAKAQEHPVSFVESSPRDRVQPKVQSHDYLKPGDKIAVRKPKLYNVATRKEVPIKEDLFANPWSIDEVRWSPDSSRFTCLFNQRGHQALRLIAIEASTGAAKAIIDETTDTFIDYSQKTFLHHVEKTGEILWMSERNGWNHLYLIDGKSGAVKGPITRGEWVVRSVERVDDEKRQVWFRLMGYHKGEDPYHIHFARVNYDGTGLTLLTEGDGTHEVRFSPDGKYLLDTYSRVDLPHLTNLRKANDGSLVVTLEKADASKYFDQGGKTPERFVAKGRDGKTDIYGLIYRPSNHDPLRKYPVIEQIYAGPHGAHVPKSFSTFHPPQAMAELGFILVQIDGMGTNWRSRAFHDVCWKNLADAGFADRIAWLKSAAKHEPSMDLERVGIYGGSAGGQNALGALLFHPEFYKAAAADCGCHDNRMDKIWWNEAWMGWPIGPHYAAQSNVTNALKLQGKLLLTVGELDHNVDPASTMQVVNALIRADKDFELIVIPGAEHGVGDGPYGRRRRRDFFVRSLLGVEPRR